MPGEPRLKYRLPEIGCRQPTWCLACCVRWPLLRWHSSCSPCSAVCLPSPTPAASSFHVLRVILHFCLFSTSGASVSFSAALSPHCHRTSSGYLCRSSQCGPLQASGQIGPFLCSQHSASHFSAYMPFQWLSASRGLPLPHLPACIPSSLIRFQFHVLHMTSLLLLRRVSTTRAWARACCSLCLQ